MELAGPVLPKLFSNVRMSLWLPGQWPSLGELMGRRLSDKKARLAVEAYPEKRHQWMEKVKQALRARGRVPLCCGEVLLGFWHQRSDYAERDRTEYSHMAERFILPPLVSSGAFRESALRGITHAFGDAEPDAAGIYVLLADASG
jgi:hypothetical protein